MKRFFLIVSLFFLIGVVFSASVDFVKYSSVSVDSHACLPSDSTCLYTKTVSIDSNPIVSCSDSTAIKVLGLSGVTNAHVEIKSLSNFYDKNICLKKALLDNNSYYFTAVNTSCKVDYNCLFGLSGTSNAHLSSCGVFGSNEIKFCVKSNLGVPQVINGVCFNHGVYPAGTTDVPLLERCLAGTDTNYSTFDSNNIARWTCQGIGTGASSVDCNASKLAGSGPVVPPINLTDCNIFSFEVKSSSITSKTKISYSCYTNGNDVNLAIFDLEGSPVFPFGGGQYSLKDVNRCDTIEKVINIDDWPLVGTKKANYLAQLSIGNNCVKQAFFTIVSEQNPNFIPDSNPLLALILCLSVIFIFTRKGEFK